MRLELFPFRYRDPLTGKRVRARYVAERHVIAERYAEYEIIGPAEIRDVDPDARYFNPHSQCRTDRAAVGNMGAVMPLPDPRSVAAWSSPGSQSRAELRPLGRGDGPRLHRRL